jgi:hypothetical protein
MSLTLGLPTTCWVGSTIVLFKKKLDKKYVLIKIMLLFVHAKNGEEHNHEQKSYPTQIKRHLKIIISNVFWCDRWGWIGILSLLMHEVGA